MRCCTTSSTTRCCTSRTCSSPCATTRCRGSRCDKRCEMEPLGHDCWQVTLHFGFKNEPDVPRALEQLRERGCVDRGHGRPVLPVARHRHPDASAAAWPTGARSCSRSMHRNAAAAADFLQPADQPRGRARLQGRDLTRAGRRARRAPAIALRRTAVPRACATCPCRRRPRASSPCWSASPARWRSSSRRRTRSAPRRRRSARGCGRSASAWASCTLLPSLWWRKPVMIAWSTPGAAVLAAAGAAAATAWPRRSAPSSSARVLIALAGATGWFERVMDRIPMPSPRRCWPACWRASALDAFLARCNGALPLVLLMLAAYLLGAALLAALCGAAACWRSASRVAARRGAAAPGRASHWALTRAGVHRARVQLAGDGEPGAAALRRHDGVAEPARRGGDPRRRLPTAGLAASSRSPAWRRCCWRRSAPSRSTWRPSPRRSAWAARRTPTRPALHRAGGQLRRDLLRDRPVRRRGRRALLTAFPHELVVAHRRPGAARHHRRRPGRGAARRAASRGGADHLPGHAARASSLGGHRLGVLGRGRRRARRCLCNSGGPRSAAPRNASGATPAAMKLLFVADPLERFKTYKDTTFAMMREAARARPRAAGLRAARPGLAARRPRRRARVREIALTGDARTTGSSSARRRRRRSRSPTSTRC